MNPSSLPAGAAPRPAALVTGGGRGLGRAIAERLARSGRAVGLVARTEAELAATVERAREEGGTARGFVADVLDARALDRAIEHHRDWAGDRLDALVCAAGQLRAIGPFEQVGPDPWWRDLETALRGAAQTIHATLPLLRASDRASICVLVGPGLNGPMAHASAYAAAQAALARFVESLAIELAPMNLPIYAVAPPLTPTALIAHLLDDAEARRWLPQFTRAFAEGKEVAPERTAEMVEWLADRRPPELSGRVVHAAQTPTILETRLGRVAADDLHRLRLR